MLRTGDTGYIFEPVFTWLRSRPRAADDVVTQLRLLRDDIEALKREQAVREAEWADVYDKFSRLYRRLVARQDRDRRTGSGLAETEPTDEARSGSGESPLSLRQRLGRRAI